MNRPLRATCGAAMLLLTVGATGATAATPASTTLASAPAASLGAVFPDAYASEAVSTPDGRYVAFRSAARNLVSGGTNGEDQIFLRDRQTGNVSLVSRAGAGAQGNAGSYAPQITDDGTKIVFWSNATNLAPGDGNEASDVFLHDTAAGTTTRVSVSSSGAELAASSSAPRITPDGAHVTFLNNAAGVIAGEDIGGRNIYLRTIATGVNRRVTVPVTGTAPSSTILTLGGISATGRYVAFHSASTNLVAGDTNGRNDVFVRDMQAGTTEIASLTSTGTQIDQNSGGSSISADGSRVTFTTPATGVVPGDDDAFNDVFVRDRREGTTRRVSIAQDGTKPNAASSGPVISADGGSVVFVTSANTLIPNGLEVDTNGKDDILLATLATGRIERVSVRHDGTQSNAGSANPFVSADGRFVFFQNTDRELVAGDQSVAQQMYLRDRGTADVPVDPVDPVDPTDPDDDEQTTTITTTTTTTVPGIRSSVTTAGAPSVSTSLDGGTLTLVAGDRAAAVRGLRARHVRVAATGAAKGSWRATVPVVRGTVASAAALRTAGTLRFRTDRRSVSATDLRVTLRGNGAGVVTANVASRRITLFTIDRHVRTAIDRREASVTAAGAPLKLTAVAAKRISDRLRLSRPLVRGAYGTITVRTKATTDSRPGATTTHTIESPPVTTTLTTTTTTKRSSPSTGEPSLGTVDWGFRQSFRTYVFNGNGQPPIAVTAGATCDTDPPSTKGGCPASGLFHFPVGAGTYDPTTGVGAATLRGSVGFDYPGHFFRLTLADPQLTISGGAVTVNAQVTVASTLPSVPSSDGRVDLGTFPIVGTPTVSGKTVTLSTGPGALSQVAADQLGGFLQAGDLLDPLTVTADIAG